MTAADKLRELLATRPTFPSFFELVRWWMASVVLVPKVLDDLEGVDRDLVAARAETAAAVQQAVDRISPAALSWRRERDQLRQDLDAARAAARALVSHVDDLALFADDNDPRVMATAGPLGAAQADLWVALGLSLEDEHARMRADIESRCAVCGWPLAEFPEKGCTRGNCSYRPRPTNLYAPARAEREAADRKEAWHG